MSELFPLLVLSYPLGLPDSKGQWSVYRQCSDPAWFVDAIYKKWDERRDMTGVSTLQVLHRMINQAIATQAPAPIRRTN